MCVNFKFSSLLSQRELRLLSDLILPSRHLLILEPAGRGRSGICAECMCEALASRSVSRKPVDLIMMLSSDMHNTPYPICRVGTQGVSSKTNGHLLVHAGSSPLSHLMTPLTFHVVTCTGKNKEPRLEGNHLEEINLMTGDYLF